MANEQVLVLGFPVDRYAELEVVLKEELRKLGKKCKLVFVETPEDALPKMAGVDVLAVNVDMCGDFLEKLFKRGYEGGIVPMTSCRKQMTKAVVRPGQKSVYPTTFRGAADEIMKQLDNMATIKGEPVLAT